MNANANNGQTKEKKMKKLILLACVAVCSVAVTANTVEWNTGTIYGPGDGGVGFGDPVAPGTPGYTATLYVFTDAAMQNAVALTGNSGSTIDDYSTINGITGDSSELVGGTYYGYMEIVDPNGRTLKSGGFSFEVSDMMGTGSVYVGDGGDAITPLEGSLDPDYGAFSPTSAWSGGDVPEPTSGLLLVLGGAMLALRRRRA